MLESLIRSATGVEYKTIVTSIDEFNGDSIALNEKNGLEHARTLMKVKYKFDRWLNHPFYQVLL